MNLIDRVVQEHYDEMGLAERGFDRSWSTVLLTPRFVTSRHVIGLVIAEGQRLPAIVVKIARLPGDNGGILREADILRQVAALTSGTKLGVPEVLGTFLVGSDTVLVETALTGETLDPVLVTKDPATALTAGVAFIASLPMTRPAVDNLDWYDRLITEPLSSLVKMVDADSGVAELCEQTHELLLTARSALLPSVLEHADLSHPNIFLAPDGGLQVVDWERASAHGLPGHDLIFFVQYLAESVAGAFTRSHQLETFSDALGEKGWARDLVTDHLRSRGVDPLLLPLLCVITWARSTATLAYRIAPGPDDAPAGQRSVVTDAVSNDRDYWLWRRAVEMASSEA